MVSRLGRAQNYTHAAAQHVLVLQRRKPARWLILEMSFALAVWDQSLGCNENNSRRTCNKHDSVFQETISTDR